MDVKKVLSTLRDETRGDSALLVLHIASYFAPTEININLLSDILDSEEDLKNAVDLMVLHSILQYAVEGTCIIIERKVRWEVQRFLRQTGEEENALNFAIEVLQQNLASKRYSALFHAMYVFSAAEEYPELMKSESNFPNIIMTGLLKQQRHVVAFGFGRDALKTLERSIGAFHESTRAVQKHVGLALLEMDRVDESLDMLVESYWRSSIALGRCKVDLNLRFIARITARSTSKPESWVRQWVFGDASVSETKNNTDLNNWCEYAMLLLTLKWKDEAMSILKQVLEKRLELLRPDDDDICRVEENIAEVHMVRQEYHEALEIYRRVHEKRKLALSENCIRTQYSRLSAALALDGLDMMDEALVEYEAVAEGIRRIEGDQSVGYLTTVLKIAYILYRQKKYERAHVLYSRLYTKIDSVLGEKDILTLDLKYSYGNVLLKLNKSDETLRVWQEVLPHFISILGAKDSDTLELKRNIDALLH